MSSVITQFRLSMALFLSLIFLDIHLCAAIYPTQLIYEFPKPTFVENLAIRPDGSILTTLATSPELYLVQPSAKNPNPQLVYRFDGSTSVTGITEIAHDTFQVAVTSTSGPGQPAPGTSALWLVSFSGPNVAKAKVTLSNKLPDVLAPNGLVTVHKDKILLADSAKGVVFAVDTKTGVSNVAITDPLFAPGPPFGIGVNGLKIRGRTLYFTNTAQNLLGQVDINLKTGAALGLASRIVNTLPPSKGYDDFTLNGKGQAFVTNAAGNFIEQVDLNTKKQTIAAGDVNSTDIAEPTSAAFGRNGKADVLFVTTGGGLFFPVGGDRVVGGQVVAVKVGKKF